MNVLVVDDDPGYRQAMEFYLKDEGKTVYSASNGEEAIEKLREVKIDFIISDIYMPIMDGLRFRKAVDAMPEFAQIPFLFVSGFDDDYTMEAVRSSPNCGFMRKAKPLEELDDWIVYLTSPAEKRRTLLLPGAESKYGRSTTRGGRDPDRYRR